MYDVIVRNGLICKGAGNPWTQLDIVIKNDRIAKVAKLTEQKAHKEIDASGHVISPGFIDTHSHFDLQCINPEIHNVKVLQGATTELFGQDGISVAPVSESTKRHWQDQMRGLMRI